MGQSHLNGKRQSRIRPKAQRPIDPGPKPRQCTSSQIEILFFRDDVKIHHAYARDRATQMIPMGQS
jgi:hypothetical protein